ncbi:unnamed protein product, partial [Choristocarpus tenellus]
RCTVGSQHLRGGNFKSCIKACLIQVRAFSSLCLQCTRLTLQFQQALHYGSALHLIVHDLVYKHNFRLEKQLLEFMEMCITCIRQNCEQGLYSRGHLVVQEVLHKCKNTRRWAGLSNNVASFYDIKRPIVRCLRFVPCLHLGGLREAAASICG